MLVLTNNAFPLILIGFSFVLSLPITLLLEEGLDFSYMKKFGIINTLMQIHVKDVCRGSVIRLYTLTFFGFPPFGNLVIGYLGEKMGLGYGMLLFDLVSLVLPRIVFLRSTQILKLS